MKTRSLQHILRHSWLLLALAVWPALSSAQVAVAEIEAVEELPTATAAELETLVGPIALYPDDLLAIVLPASTFPVQIIEAARFLQDLEDDSSLKPDEEWNDAVVALLNYPEVVDLLNEDLDWLWRLGEAVVAQQADVISAIELFRDRAYAAGNLKSDDYQLVAHEGSSIQITPVQEDVIYVPYYEPERVVVYQPRPAYYYYPRAYPLYYYPYPEYHAFHNSFFWGVTTAFSIGWHHHHLNVFHHSYYGHPYYGRSYYDNYWYRRPHINVYNNVYVNRNVHVTNDRYRNGDRWQPSSRRTVRASDQRVTRSRFYPNSDSSSSSRTVRNTSAIGSEDRSNDTRKRMNPRLENDVITDIKFRDRPASSRTSRDNPVSARPSTVKPAVTKREPTTARSNTIRPSVIKREPTTARPGTVRPTTEPNKAQVRQPQPKQSTARQSQPRQTVVRQSSPKQTQVRQSQPRQTVVRQSQPKQPTVRQSQPRQTVVRQSSPKQTQVRQSQPRQSQPRVSQPRQSQPSRSAAPSRSSSQRSQSAPSQSSKSSRVASNSSSRTTKKDR